MSFNSHDFTGRQEQLWAARDRFSNNFIQLTGVHSIIHIQLSGSGIMELQANSKIRHEESQLESALKELLKSRNKMCTNLMRAKHDLTRRQQRAAVLAATGGSPGMYEFPKTGQLLPILVGTKMVDPSGTEQEVPILGVEQDKLTGDIRPLGGTMEDPAGAGLVPIMIGEKAVDIVTGEISPVIGVRSNPETRIPVPVTLSSGGPRKNKPPPGALTMLEEEIVARKSFWRKQRQIEKNQTVKEAVLMAGLMFNLQDADTSSVRKKIKEIDELSHQLRENCKQEVQRRGASEPELANILPPDVMYVLTEVDKTECNYEESHVSSHDKFNECLVKLMNKMEQEEKRYNDRMSNLEGAQNPDAEDTALQKYKQAQSRVQNELRDQIIGCMESIDKEHSALEYARERSEICASEAKVSLTKSALLAGDYDAQLSGVYGNIDSTTSDSKLVPLLQQLIAMLESGVPLNLSSELLKLINDGQQKKVVSTRDSFSSVQVRQKETDRKPGTQQIIQSQNVKKSDSTDKTSDTVNILEGYKKADSDKNKEDTSKDLFVKQAYEVAQLENKLKNDEITSINETLNDFDNKKQEQVSNIENELKEKLMNSKTEEQKERILMDYANNMKKLDDVQEKQKQQQLSKLRQVLQDRRRRQKKDLHKQHIIEAKNEGISADNVPILTIGSNDEIMHDLLLQQQQQEQLNADLKAAGHNNEDEILYETDKEIEKKINELEISSGLKDQLIDSLNEKMRELQNNEQKLKDKLREIHSQEKPPHLTEEEKATLNDAEQHQLLQARVRQKEADRLKEEQTLIRSLRNMEQSLHHRKQEEVIKSALSNATQEEKDRIIQQFRKQVQDFDGRMEHQRQSQRDAIAAKIAARKRLREEKDKDDAVSKELDNITKAQAAKGDPNSAEAVMNIHEHLNGDKLTQEQEQLLEEQQKSQEDLELQHLEDKRILNTKVNMELRDTENLISDKIDQQKKIALDAHKAKLDRELQAKGDKLNGEEYQKILMKHKKDSEAIERNLQSERERQFKALQEKIMEKKKLKMEQLEKKHQAEVNDKLCKQQEDRDKLDSAIAKNIESTVLKDTVKNKDGKMAENVIYTVLKQRHMKEAIHLEDQLAKQREAALDKNRVDIEEKRKTDREKLLQIFEQESADLVANSGSLSNEELALKKQDLKKQQQKQLKDFDNVTTQLLEKSSTELLPELNIRETNAKLELKDRQLNELSDAMNNYSPAKELTIKYEEDAKRAREDAKKYQSEVVQKMKKELEQRKKEQKLKEEEKKKKLLTQLQIMEKSLQEEHRREEERQKQMEAEREKVKKQQLAERERSEREEIKNLDVAHSEKERLLKDHNDNIQKMEENMKADKDRSQKALQAKLAARRQKRQAAEPAKLEKKVILEMEDELKMDIKQKQDEEALFGSDIQKVPSVSDKSGPSKKTAGPVTSVSPLSGNTEEDWVNLLMASHLFKQIQDLENSLEGTSDDLGLTEPQGRIEGGDYRRPYIDVKDAQWLCDGDLKAVDINHISATQFVVYRFGVFLIRLLNQTISTPDVTLLLASNLPPNNYERNAFRNSIYFEHARKILFVRKERMESVGDFTLIILHSLAHIKVGDMIDDTNALFLKEFYKGLKIICQDMFFCRTHNTSTSQQLIGSSSIGGRKTLAQALGVGKNLDDKMNITGELVDMRADGPTKLDFSHQHVTQRLRGTESATSNSRLREHLLATSGYCGSGSFINNRLTELKRIPRSSYPTGRQGKSSTDIPKPIQSSRDVLELQLLEQESKNDDMNAELVQTFKAESELREGLQKLDDSQADSELLNKHREQLTAVFMKKEDLMKRLSDNETEIHLKKKEIKKK